MACTCRTFQCLCGGSTVTIAKALDPRVREPRIQVNGVWLSEGQAMAVRVAVTSWRLDRDHVAGVGPIGAAYDARLSEVEDIMVPR